MSGPGYRVLVVDDEPVARTGLMRLVAEIEPKAEVQSCSNGREAVRRLVGESFDLVLLDIEMPELDGFGVVEEVGVRALPAVIFVTAFDRYALRAFDAHALDYVLKPVDPERLRAALERARTARRAQREGQRLATLVDELSGRTRRPERVAARVGGRLLLVPVDEIDWIEAADNYVRLHLGERVVLQRETLARLVERLGPERFVRVHRSHAVHLERVREVRTAARGDAQVVLAGGTTLAVSRRYREALERALGT